MDEMKYSYGGSSFPNGRQALAACAHDFITAGGNNNDATVRECLAGMTDEQLANEMIEGFGLDRMREPAGGSGYSMDDRPNTTTLEDWDTDNDGVVSAMRELREEILATPTAVDESDADDGSIA